VWKVLIVDDEVLSVQYVVSLLDWESEGFQRPYTVLTASSAQEKFTSFQPDIVLMDIRMPVMDGMKLSQWMLAQDPNCRIIILTAYRDFSYAQQAVSLGICSFLLKHEISAETLREALLTACGDMERERVIAASAVEKWLYHRLMNGGDEPLPAGAWPKGKCWVLTAERTDRWYGLLPAQPRDKAHEVRFPNQCVCFTLRENLYCRLLCLPKMYSPSSLRALIAQYRNTLPAAADTSMLYTEPVETLADLHPRLAWDALAQELIVPAPALLSEAEYMTLRQCSPSFSLNYVMRAEELVHLRGSGLQAWVSAPLRELDGAGRCPVNKLQILSALLGRLDDRLRLTDRPGIRAALRETRKMDGSWQGFCAALEDILQIFTEPPPEDTSHAHNYAQEAARIMLIDYGQRLNSSVLAHRLHVSEGHLRTVFKRKYGCTVKDYLRKTRLSAARQMLLDDNRHIYEIARQCGFTSSQHFSQVFKDETGVSPLDFQNGRGGAL